jgi:hypothetical protein
LLIAQVAFLAARWQKIATACGAIWNSDRHCN